MAHPSNQFPKNFALVNEGQTVTGNFYAIQVLVAADANMSVKGSGILEYLASDAGTGTHLDSSGNVLGDTHGAGFYEALSTQAVTLPCVAGSTIYGKFNSVTGEAGDSFIVYF